MRRLSSRRKRDAANSKNANKGIVASILADHRVAPNPTEENEMPTVFVEEREPIEKSEIIEERQGVEKANADTPTILGVALPDHVYLMSLYSESTKVYHEISLRVSAICPTAAATGASNADNIKTADDCEASEKQSKHELNKKSQVDDSEAASKRSSEEKLILESVVTTKASDKDNDDDDDDNSIAMVPPNNIEDNGDDLAKSLERLRGLTCVYDEAKCHCGHTEAGETLNEVGRALAEIEVVKSLSRFLEAENHPEATTPDASNVPNAPNTPEESEIIRVEEDNEEGIEVPLIPQDDQKEVENIDVEGEKEDAEVLDENVQSEENKCQDSQPPTDASTSNGTEDQQEQQEQEDNDNNNSIGVSGTGASDDESLTEEEILEKAIRLSLNKESLE